MMMMKKTQYLVVLISKYVKLIINAAISAQYNTTQQSNLAFFVTGELVLILMPFITGIAHDA